MNNYKSINTLEELQQAKEQLRMEMKVSRHELFRTLETTRSQAKSYFWRGLAIPAGLLGLGAVGMRVARSSFNHQMEKGTQALGLNDIETPLNDAEGTPSKWYMQLLPVALNLFQMYLASRNNENDELSEEEHAYYQANGAYQTGEDIPQQAPVGMR